MKSIIYILCYCIGMLYCVNGQPEWLTEDEIFEHFGTTNGSAPTYGIAEISIPSMRSKRESNVTQRFSIMFSDGKAKYVNLIRKDGILANIDTPVWYAAGVPNSDRVVYASSTNLYNLGKFAFYHDFDNKAAIVIFYNLGVVEGFVGHYRFKQAHPKRGRNLRGKNKYLLIPDRRLTKLRRFGTPVDIRAKRASEINELLRNEPVPETVYPQLLIQLDQADAQKDLSRALIDMLVYWNAVDMLYSNLKNPQIKLNIAGFIAPENNFAAPWITKAQLSDHIDVYSALPYLGNHFVNYSHIFPSSEHDYMISFTSKELNAAKTTLGYANVDASCLHRSQRVAIVKNDLENFITGAHELGHLLSVQHDDEVDCADDSGIMSSGMRKESSIFQWSKCAKHSIQNMFKKYRSTCLDNCPRTNPNCGNVVAPTWKGLDTLSFSCVRDPVAKCHERDPATTIKYLQCGKYMLCAGGPKTHLNGCDSHNVVEGVPFICAAFGPINFATNFVERIGNGVLCNWNNTGPLSACHNGECIPIDERTPLCD